MVDVDVILPVLNEADALGWVLSRLPDGARAIVVDNGSTDGSAAIAASLGAVVVREEVPGFGSACFAGLMAAERDIVCFLDADGSIDPQHIAFVVDPVRRGTVDLMLGARRPIPGAMKPHQRLANRYLAYELRRRTGGAMTDLGPLRAARREELIGLGLLDRRSGWPLEMVLRASRAGWRLDEIGVPYAPRRAGKSKVTGTLKGTIRAVQDMSRLLIETTEGQAADRAEDAAVAQTIVAADRTT